MDDEAAPIGGGLILTGSTILAIGAALPWFTVGPASQLGVETSGRWVVLLALAIAVGAIAVRRGGGAAAARWIAAAGGVAAAICIARALVPPDSTSAGIGVPVCLVGAALIVGGAVRELRRSAPVEAEQR